MAHIGVMLPDPLRPDWLHVPGEQVQPTLELFVPASESVGTPPYLHLQPGGYYDVEGLSTVEREARTVRWEIPLLVLNQELVDVLVRLAPLAAPVAEGLAVDTSGGVVARRLSAHGQQARERFGQELAAAVVDLPRLNVAQ